MSVATERAYLEHSREAMRQEERNLKQSGFRYDPFPLELLTPVARAVVADPTPRADLEARWEREFQARLRLSSGDKTGWEICMGCGHHVYHECVRVVGRFRICPSCDLNSQGFGVQV